MPTEVHDLDGVIPLTKAAFDALNEEDKKGWQPLMTDATRFIPKGFSLVTKGRLTGRAVPHQVHSRSSDPNQTVTKTFSVED
jgi:hypothetical protein